MKSILLAGPHFALGLLASCIFCAAQTGAADRDPVADNMLAYQRSVGGWPKHIGNEKIDYTRPLSPAEQAALHDDAGMNDATIDNDATSKEIKYLIKAYKRTGNKRYLEAVNRGIRYLLTMQYKNGGFPQFYPDFSLYRSEITYNDNAMVNALNILYDVAGGLNDLDQADPAFRAPAADAVQRGISCMLNTQIRVNGQLTAWCAQYDAKTLKPAKARSYELPSLSGDESVGIIEFLMRIPQPSPAIRDAINSAVAWLQKVKIGGYEFVFVDDPSQPGGRDRVCRPAAGSVIWARFYEIETNEPFFCGRDGIKKKTVAEIEHERRVGYGWYGEWPRKLLEKDYPAWQRSLTIQDIPTEAINGARLDTANTIIVDQSGQGDFRTIQEAINSLSDASPTPRRILIHKGIYREKISLAKNNIILQGEDREHTIIVFSEARDAWRCAHPDDWGVATLNLRGSDITLADLTIENSYGFEHLKDTTLVCMGNIIPESTKVLYKDIPRNGHQMALRSFETTRLKVLRCTLRAYGGDTVSPWNVAGGMFYFADCTMEGGVDFYCPRGWAYAERCTFIADNGPASIWHDGSADPDSKTVLSNCTFTGYDGFKLGRFHRDAQFILLHCRFAKNMADQDIYLVPTSNKIQWGRRVYYYDCHKDGKAYGWYADNLPAGLPAPGQITADWVFQGRWFPASGKAAAARPTVADSLALTVMNILNEKSASAPLKWAYEPGVFWQGLEACEQQTGNGQYLSFTRQCVDRLVDAQGNILTYKKDDFNLDNVLSGRTLLYLYKQTGNEAYLLAADRLRQQLRDQPRTKEGGFWHKQRYPWQVWLDGLYMAQPFYAEYAQLKHEDSAFDDIARQLLAIYRHTRDPRTGLLYHGWDESRGERWADPATGHSPNFWGRAMGWYGMALVDVLDHFPDHHPARDSLVTVLNFFADAIAKVQDQDTGLWWDIPDRKGEAGNYPEASATCMFIYTLAKGVRKGYLTNPSMAVAQKAYDGVLKHFITRDAEGHVNLEGTVSVSGLGGNPYRDGSYAYYTKEPVVVNDLKGVGAFLLAASEMQGR